MQDFQRPLAFEALDITVLLYIFLFPYRLRFLLSATVSMLTVQERTCHVLKCYHCRFSNLWLLKCRTGTSLAEGIIHTPPPPPPPPRAHTLKYAWLSQPSFPSFSLRYGHTSTLVYSHNIIIDPVKGPRFIFLCDGNSHWTHKLCALEEAGETTQTAL